METTDNAEQLLEKLDIVLNEYDNQHGIKVKLDNKVEQYLNYSIEDFNRLTPDQCGEISAVLAIYSIFIQKEQNRQSARVRWCESVIDNTIAQYISQYKTQFQTFEERKLLAINGNSFTKKLNDLRIKASTRLSEIYGISSKIDLYIRTLLDLQQSKRRNHAS